MQLNPLAKCFGRNKRFEYAEIPKEKLVDLLHEVPCYISVSSGVMQFTELPNGNYKVRYERKV